MTAIKKKKKSTAKSHLEFIGKAWVNEVKNEDSLHFGKRFLRLTLDRDIEEVNLSQQMNIILFPQDKRKGKKDADFRWSISPKTEVEEEEKQASCI